MSQTSGGFLLPLGPLMGQKRVAPSETESGETEGFSKSSKEESVPKTLELPVTSSTEDKNAAVIEDNNRSQTSVNPLASMPPKESISPEESMHKEKFDHLNGSGPPNSFAKSLQHAETLLWNRLQPSWRWLMTKHQAEDSYSDTDSDDSLLSLDVDNRFPSGRLPEAEQIAFDLGKCCQLQRSLKGALFHGHVKSLPMDIQGTADFQYHQAISSLANNYAKLQILLERRSCILLNKAYAISVRGASKFVRKLTELLIQEQEMANKVKLGIDHSSVTSIKKVGRLCEELRCHTCHWKCLGEKIKNDPWLNCQLIHMKETFNCMKQALTLLGIYAVLLMEQYISSVLCTLAYAEPYSVPSESFWEFFRGLEIFNSIVSESNIHQSYLELKNCVEINVNESDLLSQRLKVKLCRTSGNWKIEPFLIERVLRILANERGRIASQCFYKVITTNKTFLSTVSNNNLTAVDWENIKMPFLQRFTSSHNIFCGEEIKTSLCRSKLGDKQEELEPCSCKNSIQEFCMEDEVLLNHIVDGLVTSNMLWQHVLNRPKPDKPQETEAEDLQLQHTIFSAENNLQQGLEGLLPSDCEPFVKDLCLCMLSRIALIHWDQVFCSALGSALKDKCFPDPERKEDTVRSRTAGLFLELFHPLCVMLTWLNVEQAQKEDARTGVVRKLVVPSILVRTMSHCITTMQTSSHWLMTKGFQFLSSWSMNQFLLVIQGDLKLLRAMASKMLRLAETLCTEEVSSQGIQETLLLAQVTALVKELGDAAAIFNTFSVTALTIFSTNCKRMAIEIFEQSMPVGRQWRVNYRSVELSSKPNEYATAAVQTVIGQVLEGIQPLPEDAQTIPLTAALTAFMEAWMDHILKQKITFSLQGALQLKQDFDMIREFIRSDECQLSMEIRQALLSLHVFHQVDNAIICLLQQPTRKVYIPSNTWEPFRRCCRIGTERERGPRFAAGAWRRRSGARALTSGPGSSSTRTVDFSQRSLNSLDSLDLRAERTRAICQPEASTGSELLSKIRATGHPESYLAVNQQEWLALRADSNRRRKVLRLPCMNKTQEQ
uniref:uncharacterized protein ccdc142 isoform X4 n=1 Tax=Pristiophorus japonicus TaxID=55135 RepID=UPI00398F7883